LYNLNWNYLCAAMLRTIAFVQVHAAMMSLSSQNQELMEQKLDLQEKVRLRLNLYQLCLFGIWSARAVHDFCSKLESAEIAVHVCSRA